MPVDLPTIILYGLQYHAQREKKPREYAFQEYLKMIGKTVLTKEEIQSNWRMTVPKDIILVKSTPKAEPVDNTVIRAIVNGLIDDVVNAEQGINFSTIMTLFPEIAIQNLDLAAKLTFRKTSPTYRFFIDSSPLHINHLIYKYNDKRIEVIADDGLHVEYEWNNGQYLVSQKGKQKMVDSEEDWKHQLVGNDLFQLFLNKKLTIGTLEIVECRHPTSDIDLEYYGWNEWVAFLYGQKAGKMKVKNFKLKTSSLAYKLRCLIRELDGDTLKSIDITHDDSVEEIMFGGGVMDLEPWQKAKEIRMKPTVTFVLELERSFSHFDKSLLKVDCASEGAIYEELMSLKDKLLLNPALNQMKVRTINFSPPAFEMVTDRIRALRNVGGMIPRFQYPGTNEWLHMEITQAMIWFKGPCYEEDEEE